MPKKTALVSVHFDGQIAAGHQISVRVLALSLLHTQKAIERAHLDIKYGGVWKYARMKNEDYEETEFITRRLKRGGIICDFFSTIKKSADVVDRVSSAINEVRLQGKIQYVLLRDQISSIRRQVLAGITAPISFKEFSENPGKDIVREYGDRSIGKEIDQVLSTLRRENAGDSTLSLSLTGSSTQVFDFNRVSSQTFHDTVARRSVTKPIIYKGKLIALDRTTLKGKFENSESHRTSVLHFNSDHDFLLVHPFLASDSDMLFIGSPLIEFGSVEPYSGDVIFMCLIDKKGAFIAA